MSRSRKLAYCALLLIALIWGSAFPIVKPVFNLLTPMQYLYFRFLAAGLFALPIFLYFYLKVRPKISYVCKVLGIELLGIPLPLLILYEGLSRTSALESSLIVATGPIFVVLGGILFLHERESKREWQGLALSLAGSLMIVTEPLILGTHTDTAGSATGNLLILFYNILWAIYALIAKRTYKKKPPLYFGSLTYLITSLIYGVILSASHTLPDFHLLTLPSVFIPVLYMALPGGILCFLLYLYAQSKIEVSEANLFTYLDGVVAIPAAYLLLGEKPSLFTIAAIIVVVLGVYRAETHNRQR
jgi:drug/metabolite transporter (DMT)-like permease